MDNELFDDLMQSLNEAIAYTQGDTTQGRSHFVTMSDSELEKRQLLWEKISRLSEFNIQRVDGYVDELIRVG